MATSITTIQSTDLITNSRADINNNFDSLLVNKIETDVLTTDSTFTAASDSKIPSQLAVKQYVDAGGNVNASTTAKGIVEQATEAEVLAGTATGTTGASLFVNPSNLAARLSSSVNFGDGSDGDVTVAGTTTITRDMFYNNLTVTGTLNTDGYRVFVKGTLSGTGTIANNNTSAGGDGPAGTVGGPGIAGTAKGSGIWKGVAGSAGGAGGDGSPAAVAGTAGINGNKGVAGAAGGAGGNGSSSNGAAAGGAGTNDTTKPIFDKFNAINFAYYSASATLAQYSLTGSGGGGGAGGENGVGYGGSGGGSGGTGGVIILIAKTWAGNFTISATGANGGAGGAGAAGNTGGGGGGAGGAGGTVIVVYGTKTWTGSYTLTGGTGGAGGAKAGTGTDGAAGSNGTTGVYYEYDILSLL